MPPAPPEKLRLQLSPNGRRVQAVIEPRPDTSLTGHDVLAQLKTMGCGDWAVFNDTIMNLPKLFKSVKQTTLADIAEKRDAIMTLTVGSDELAAHLTLTPPRGGTSVTQQDVLALLARHKVKHGVLRDAVTAAVATQTAGQITVAQATLPAHGDDARFEILVPEITAGRAQENPHGRVEYREISSFRRVQPGTPLLRKIPATSGTGGTTVTGKIIPARPGRDLPFTAPLDGMMVDTADGNLLLAAISGQAVIVEHGVRVEPVIELNNVDLSSGDIDFEGTVYISGDVAAGLRIRTRSDIFVGGTVEGATLEAGGNIKVNKGVIGRGELRQEDRTRGVGLARLTAAGSVQARFMENALIETGGDVLIDELLAHCEVTAEGAVVVGKAKARKGHILGGSIRAAHGIHAQVIGSAAGVRTTLDAGTGRRLRHNIDAARDALIVKCAERDKLTTLLKRAAQLQEELLLRTQAALATTEEELKQLNTQRDALQQQLGEDSNARITAGVRVHEGTTLVLGETTLAVDHEYGPGTFTLHGGEIVFTPH